METKKPKIIVFDIGGVLLDWRGGLSAVSDALQTPQEKVHVSLMKKLPDLELGLIEGRKFWESIASEYHYSGETDNLAKYWVTGQSIIPESWNLLKDLKRKYRVVACTNLWTGVIEELIKNNKDFNLLEIVVDSSAENVSKPDPRMYRIVEERTGEHGDNLFLIDDSLQNCEGANNCGWQSLVFSLGNDGGKEYCDRLRNILL